MCEVKVKVKLLSRVQLFATPRTAAYQASPSMGFFQARVLEWVAISFSKGYVHKAINLNLNGICLLYFVLPPFKDSGLLFWAPDVLC